MPGNHAAWVLMNKVVLFRVAKLVIKDLLAFDGIIDFSKHVFYSRIYQKLTSRGISENGPSVI